MDINTLLQAVPDTVCVVPFLLQRSEPRKTMLTFVMNRFDDLVEKEDLPSIKLWLKVIVESYSKSVAAIAWDLESAHELQLLSASSLLDPEELSLLDEIVTPKSCYGVLTQSELLQFILLRHAKLSVEKAEKKNLEIVCSMSIHYLIEIEKKSISPCFPLQCLVIALLLKCGRLLQLSSYLSARETQWIQIRRKRHLDISTHTRMDFDVPNAAIAYAEILFKIGEYTTLIMYLN